MSLVSLSAPYQFSSSNSFLAWSLSFYPQPILNYRRRSTAGFNPDFPSSNTLGFVCYTLTTALQLWSPTIRSQYAARHPLSPVPTVRVNDFVFALHAAVLCVITWSQFWPRLWGWPETPASDCDRDKEVQRMSRTFQGLLTGCHVSVLLVTIAILSTPTHGYSPLDWCWLDLLTALGTIKLLITIVKYTPQVYTNYKLQSTRGWAIDTILLDFTGGVLSLGQLLIDSSLQGGVWEGVKGNGVKLGLSGISIAYDLVFFVQHYVLYRKVGEEEAGSEEQALLDSHSGQ